MTREWWAETLGVSRPTQGIPLGEEGGTRLFHRVPDAARGSLDPRWSQAGSADSAMLVASRAPASIASQLNRSHSARPAPPFANAAAASR